ncbi:toll/interleukin-1 receptor domain-containing protein [Aquimarina sp. AD10]|uniref:toll/interleukin-1 receptor domain-containing protein n=1 Tax=Aquimarina sp. AD10 TaxID=1714849 RepID=UPI000E52F130|nr:toll/interleukin-1 receptor domain-containing protein [Aquimarina sp. AD10]AXT59669.1 toll/interleukin-1 receptor domain-containing protein [Aquimarina sp. AD10]RKM97545.1 TIR domain-containing protein [Aquimarina sp. AD10]
MKRDGVFISYSKKDVKWLDYLRVHLSFLEREYKLTIWEDSKIEVGAEWRTEINKAISATKVAILMVSANFLSSEFINNEELPALLAAAKEEGAYIFPIIVSHCMFSDIEAISKFQTINPPTKPLTVMDEGQIDALFVKVTREVKRVLSSDTVTPHNHNIPTSIDVLKASFIRVKVMNILFSKTENIDGLSIKEIYTLSNIDKRKEVIRVIHELEALEILDKSKKGNITYYKLTSLGHNFISEHALL